MHPNTLENITKLSYESQNQRLRLFARVDLDTKIKIIKLQKATFHKYRNIHRGIDNSTLTLASLINAIDLEIGNKDKVDLNVVKFKAKQSRRKIKREKLLSYWSIVKTLKEKENMSFCDISKYFLKYHKLEVSYSTIYTMWHEIEIIEKEKGNEV